MAWLADSSGFFYTRYPRPGERDDTDLFFYQQLWLRTLGTPLSADRYEVGKDFDRIAEMRIELEPESGKLLLNMQYGDSGRFQLHLRSSDGHWQQLTDYEDEVVQAVFMDANSLLALSRKNAPRGKFLRLAIDKPDRAVTTLWSAESEDVLESNYYGDKTFIVHHQKVYATAMLGGPSELRIFDLQGQRLPAPELPPVSGLGQLIPWGENTVLARHYSFLKPNNWLLVEGASVKRHSLSSTSPVSYAGYTVVREFATSKDGTRVPMTLIMAEGTKRDGSNPTLATGYGGYGISSTPYFSPNRMLWLEQGGIYVDTNLRGGSEYGSDWHEQGRLTQKQNVYDDFAAVLEHLVSRGYTSPDILAIEGGSNGGLLMGAIINQHPGAVRAVISHVGVYDSLRSELEPNGAFNIPEFGTVTDEAQYRALRAYSPYHNVRPNSDFPSILLMTGENDGRVDPYHSRKMIAALQAASSGDQPILLRTSGNSGHGAGTPLSEVISQQVDRLSFLFHELGVKYREPAHH
jgi:prolyl oligopeptidase